MNLKISKNKGAGGSEKEWVFMWSITPITILHWSSAQAIKERNDVFPSADLFQYYDGSVMTAYIPKHDIERYKKDESIKYLDAEYFRKYLANYKKEIKGWWRWVRKIERKDYKDVNEKELADDLQQFAIFMRDAIGYFASTRSEFTYSAEKKLEELLKKYYGDKWPDIFGILAMPLEFDIIQEEHLELLNLIDKKSVGREFLLAHIYKYPWLIVDQLDEEKAIGFVKKRIEDEKESYGGEKEKIQENKRKLKQEQVKIFEKLNSEDVEKVKYLSNFLQTQGRARMEIKAYWAGCFWLARNMWNKIAELLKLNVIELLMFLGPVEIKAALEGSSKEDIRSLIEDRKKSFAIDFEENGGDIRILNSSEADRLFKERIKKISNPDNIISGQAASVGYYKGRVKKIIAGDFEMLQGAIKEFKKGEILVTSMTQPNMMVIAKRAGAIIADEGGITSHAAVISRELGIPCIVGTKNAMQILEDGDLVEVDANNAIIKLIKKAKR